MTVNMIGRVIHMKTEPKILQRWECEALKECGAPLMELLERKSMWVRTRIT
jgi:hypothetical protein